MSVLYCKGYARSSYPLYLSEDEYFSDLFDLLPKTQNKFVVIDKKLIDIFPDLFATLKSESSLILPIVATEKHKSLKELEKIFEKIYYLRPNRDDILIAIGGGLTMNLAGLAASLIMRGLRFYYVPTTLTGQIDACMGSKQAVNYRGAKNWLGMFNDPEFCYINPHFLKTLSEREFNSQVIEGIKLCLSTDKELFKLNYPEINKLYNATTLKQIEFITAMIMAKIHVLKKDLLEENYGMSMLYGHTIGHAIEMLNPRQINHGEAIGLGMLAASRISNKLGIADGKLVTLHRNILDKLQLPSTIPKSITPDMVLTKLAHNKKNYGGKIRFVLLEDVGQMTRKQGHHYITVPENIVLASIKECY